MTAGFRPTAPPTAALLALRVDALTCRRGDREVFSGLSFSVAAGQVLLVTGPNGAGKTTLLLTLAGLLRPVAGTIEWTGRDRHELVHHLGHAGAVKPTLTVAENVAFWRDFYGADDTGEDAISEAGLAELASYPAGVLSAGQTQRLALARLRAVRRPVWLLDEPTSGLDGAGEDWVRRLVATHLDAGGLAVIASHRPGELAGDGAATLSLPSGATG